MMPFEGRITTRAELAAVRSDLRVLAKLEHSSGSFEAALVFLESGSVRLYVAAGGSEVLCFEEQARRLPGLAAHAVEITSCAELARFGRELARLKRERSQ